MKVEDHRGDSKKYFDLKCDAETLYVRILPITYKGYPSFRAGLMVTEKIKGKMFKGKRISDEGEFLNSNGEIINDGGNLGITIYEYQDKAEKLKLNKRKYDDESEKQNERFSKEKGFSEITRDWGKKYSDGIIRLNRWVSGISSYGNHVFKGFEKK